MSVPTYHVALRAGKHDRFRVGAPAEDTVIMIGMEGAPGDDQWRLTESVWDQLGANQLMPTQAATDFFRFATAAYCADLRVPHRTAFDRWSRNIILHVPVANPSAWEGAGQIFRELLGFLTGDNWTLAFRAATVAPGVVMERGRVPSIPDSVTHVSLLSGGLDSAIGALDLLDANAHVVFVSHNSKSGGAVFSSPAQRSVIDVLRRYFAADQIHHLRFLLNPPRVVTGVTKSVTTTRSRSIMFFALGLLTASAIRRGRTGEIPLVVPENGLISLNVPLTPARIGSWSTRTTHPHTIAMLRMALKALDIPIPVQLPYAAMTKGEMLSSTVAVDRARAKNVTDSTVSCAHPNQSRFLPADRRERHCGTCVPCIIRRAATQHAGVDDGRYSFDLPSELSLLRPKRAEDSHAFVYALETRRRLTNVLELGRSGPLHAGTDAEVKALCRVYDSGMDEVARHLGVEIGD